MGTMYGQNRAASSFVATNLSTASPEALAADVSKNLNEVQTTLTNVSTGFRERTMRSRKLDIGNSDKWYSIATLTMPQGAATATIKFYGGSGYNTGTVAQTSKHEFVMRSGNNNPKGITMVLYTDGFDYCPFKSFGWSHIKDDDYELFGLSRSDYSTDILVQYDSTHPIKLTCTVEQAVPTVTKGTAYEYTKTAIAF